MENLIIKQNYDLQSLESNFIKYLDVKKSTSETYKIALKQFFTWTEINNIKQPTRDDIIAYREELVNKVKPTTIQGYLIALRQFFKWTDMLNIYPNITNNVKGVKIDNLHKRDALTLEQIKKVLTSITNVRDYALLSLMTTCGLRTIEIERANIEDIQTIGNINVLFVQGKGKDEKAEYVVLPNQVYIALKTYISTRKDNNNALFISISNKSNGKRLVTRSIRGIVKQYFRNNDLDSSRLSAHSLRHTAGTLALLSGSSIEEVQQMLRHKKIDTTMIYLHHLERVKNESETRVANAIFN